MTNILAIETSSVYCSIGLAKNKEIYIEYSQEENTHGKNIFGFINNLLNKSQRPLFIIGNGVKQSQTKKRFYSFAKSKKIPFLVT